MGCVATIIPQRSFAPTTATCWMRWRGGRLRQRFCRSPGGLRFSRRRAAAKRFLFNLRRLPKIIQQLQEWKTDLVYSNSSVFCVGALAAARLGLPHVWHIREFGARDYDLHPDVGKSIFRRTLLTADATVFVSQALKNAVLGKRKPPSVHVVYNGVAAEAVFDERRRKAESLRDRRQPFTFVLVGRFRTSKGQDSAIRAFAQIAQRHRDTRLLLVGGAGHTGDQEYFTRCRELVHTLGLSERVEFWGYVPEPERAYLAADAALMCSSNEAMGRVTVEAMSACRPVIGFASGGTPELIENDHTGLLYSGGADTLAEKMEMYVKAPGLARSHGKAAWQVARAAPFHRSLCRPNRGAVTQYQEERNLAPRCRLPVLRSLAARQGYLGKSPDARLYAEYRGCVAIAISPK